MISTIANNLLSDTENEKFRRFKSTNTLIKKNLMEVKGALEYVIEVRHCNSISTALRSYSLVFEQKSKTSSLIIFSLPLLETWITYE